MPLTLPLTILWIEGLDLDETLFDTGKLSIIRGASRAYEEMPYAACAAFPGATVVALGASMVGLIVPGDAVAEAVKPLLDRLETNGCEPDSVARDISDSTSPDLGQFAPFAHLRFHHAIVPVVAPGGDGEIALAIEKARAEVRVKQLREPGVRYKFKVNGPGVDIADDDRCEAEKMADVPDQPCAFDGLRPAEVIIAGPPTPADAGNGQKFSCHAVSRSSGARWQFGRALRQRLYADARAAFEASNGPRLGFVDDFQEMVQKEKEKAGALALPRLWEDGKPAALPVSAINKIAVFNADGDKFTTLRQRLKSALGTADGQQVFSIVLEHKMRGLLTTLVGDLVALRDLNGAAGTVEADARAAVSLPYPQTERHGIPRQQAARRVSRSTPTKETEQHGIPRQQAAFTDQDRLLRFETLLFGGDDTLFVVPCWLGWWLATRFFEITNGWTFDQESMTAAFSASKINSRPQAEIDAMAGKLEVVRRKVQEDPFAMRFSAGLVFADRKAPIRALKDFAHALMTQAKAIGGLEVEVLESLEPPEGGLGDFRDRLFGRDWLAKSDTENEHSRLTVPRSEVGAHYKALVDIWCGKEALPAGPLHQALRAARNAGDLAAASAAEAAKDALDLSGARSRADAGILSQRALWPRIDDNQRALRLNGILQQRDYVRAGNEWLSRIRSIRTPSVTGGAS